MEAILVAGQLFSLENKSQSIQIDSNNYYDGSKSGKREIETGRREKKALAGDGAGADLNREKSLRWRVESIDLSLIDAK